MPASWTSEQVTSFAPDAASLKSGRTLATAKLWKTLGQTDAALWGEIKGSGANPYQVGIDLNGPAFKCSCPSRKFPCKHGLGLSFLFAASPTALSTNTPPSWISDWLQQRTKRTEQSAPKVAAPVDDATLQKRAAAQEKRAAQRQDNIHAGLQELHQRLQDVVRQGLVAHEAQSYRMWDDVAKRMIDAQAPGVARLVRELASLPHTGPGWQERVLTRLGQLHLLIQAFRRLETCSPEQQADIKSLVGLPHSRESVLAQEGIRDHWWVVGRQVEVEDALRVQRSWLWGARSQRPALLLHFAAGNQPLDTSLAPGLRIEADLVFYPSAWPIRALVKTQGTAAHAPHREITAGFATIDDALRGYADTIARYPWVERYPLALTAVVPMLVEDRWIVHDTNHHELPVTSGFTDGWRLFAMSGGHPVALFGEWNGESLLPLSVVAEQEEMVVFTE